MLLQIYAVRDVGRVSGTRFTAHREMRGFQIGNHCTDFCCGIARVLIGDGSEPARRNHPLKGTIAGVNEVSSVVCIAHCQSHNGVFVVATHLDVSVNVGGAEGQRAFPDHEVTLGKLLTLIGNHLFVNIGTSQFLMHRSRTCLKSSNPFTITQSIVTVTKIVITNPLLKHFDRGSLFLLIFISTWLSEGHRINGVIFWQLSNSMTPMLTVQLSFHVCTREFPNPTRRFRVGLLRKLRMSESGSRIRL